MVDEKGEDFAVPSANLFESIYASILISISQNILLLRFCFVYLAGVSVDGHLHPDLGQCHDGNAVLVDVIVDVVCDYLASVLSDLHCSLK